MSDVPPTSIDGDAITYIPVSRIKSRALRRVAVIALYPVLAALILVMLPFAVVRKVIILQIGLALSTVRVWRMP